MSERVLVIGGTRGTGLLVVKMLVREGARVRALARDPQRATEVLPRQAELVVGDITQPHTLPPALDGMDHVIFTAGVTKRPAGEALVRTTELTGLQHVLAAARQRDIRGRFVYMTSIGTATPSLSGWLLNKIKGNTLKWRLVAEQEIRASGLQYTIVRAGFLLNASGGRHNLQVAQENFPLSPRYRVARGDVAECLVAALKSPETRDTTFDLVWAPGTSRAPWPTLFARLVRDRTTRAA